MSFRDDLRNKLGDRADEVIDLLGDDFNFDVVPRTRLNAVIRQRDEARAQLSEAGGGTQHQQPNSGEPAKQHGDKAQPSVDEQLQQMREQHEKEMLALKVRYAGLNALSKAGAVDPEVAFSLLDQSKLTLGDNGTITGLDEQIAAQKESKKYLYPVQNGRDGTPGGTGKNGSADDKFAKVSSKDDFLKLSYDDQVKFKEQHPQLFKKFLNS